jgi:hypothetical protein
MANIGRVWKRLFERDFGFRTITQFVYLPHRYHMPPLPLLPTNAIRYSPTREASAVGAADYLNGLVSWTWTSPNFITPGAFARLEWVLTNNAQFGLMTVYYGVAGVDWYKQVGLASNPTYPNFSAGSAPVWIIPPIPGAVLGTFNPAPWRWSYGLPQ